MNHILLSEGLKISHIIYQFLLGNNLLEEALEETNTLLIIDAIKNGREVGYSYSILAENGETLSLCTYEHRNSDSIILRETKDFFSFPGELPFKKDNSDYIRPFHYHEIYAVSEILAKEIITFINNNKKNEHKK